MATNYDFNNLNSMVNDIHLARLKNAEFRHYHSKMEDRDIGQDVGKIVQRLKTCLNRLCIILYKRYAESGQRKEKNNFTLFKGKRDDKDINGIFERFKGIYSKSLFEETKNALNKEQENVLKVFFEFQPVTRVLDGSVNQETDNCIRINVESAHWLQTLIAFRNDAEHEDEVVVTNEDVQGGKLQFVEVPAPYTSIRDKQIASIVIAKWIDVVTQICTRTLQCIATEPPTSEKLSAEYISWNDDFIIVNRIAKPWSEFLYSVDVAKGNF